MNKNWKMKKTELDREKYSEAVSWCIKNGYHIEENGGIYEIVENSAPVPPTNEEIRQQRENYRRMYIDGRTSERSRKMANHTWTDEDERAYLQLDADVTAWIEQNLPYPE